MISSLNAIVPMLCVTAAGLAAMVAESFRDPGERMPIAGLGIVGLVGAAVATLLLWNHNVSSFGVVSADNFGLFVTWILIIVGALSIAFSGPTVERERLPAGEYYALMLFAIAGMMLMATASDLLIIFLALEVLSIAVYVLTGIRRDSAQASEAAFKYFLLGAFSSTFFLYGIAFTYGLTGSTHLDRVGSLIAAQAMAPTPMQLLAVGFLLVGFAFKVSAVPFHMWTPDAYEGAPPAVTGFMSTGVKAGLWNEHPGLAALMTIFLLWLGGFPPMAGFIAKWYVFSAAVKAGDNALAIIGVLTSVVSVFFYLRIVVMMYMTSSSQPVRFPAVPKIASVALAVSAILIFYLGILPTRVLDWAAESISTIF